MQSTDISRDEEWVALNADNVRNVQYESYTYCIRARYPGNIPRCIPRIICCSDIVYCGCTGQGHNRLHPLDGSSRGTHTASANIDRLRCLGFELEFFVRECTTRQEAADIESQWLHDYCHDHVELPPLNNSMPRRRLDNNGSETDESNTDETCNDEPDTDNPDTDKPDTHKSSVMKLEDFTF